MGFIEIATIAVLTVTLTSLLGFSVVAVGAVKEIKSNNK